MSTQPGTAFPRHLCCQFCGSGDYRCWIVTFAAVHAFCDFATRGSICRCARPSLPCLSATRAVQREQCNAMPLRSERHAQQCKCVCTLRHSADVCFVCGCRKAKRFAFLSLNYFRVRFVSISVVVCIQLLIIVPFSSSSTFLRQRFIISLRCIRFRHRFIIASSTSHQRLINF